MDDGSGGYLCPVIPNIESKNLKVYWNGSWNFVDSNFGSLQDRLSPPKCNYPRTMYNNFFYWSVN